MALNRFTLGAVLVAALAGCGCGNPKATVSGTVTHDGKGVSGVILFIPQDGAKYREAVESPIIEGRYEVSSTTIGLKRVEVQLTTNGVGDPSLAVKVVPHDVELKPGHQSVDFTLSDLK
jgi:hypothetical protein